MTVGKASDQTLRGRYPVLVTDAQTMGSLAVIRSLGRAGYPVHACASRADALGLRSRYASASGIHPDYTRRDFLEWLRRYIQMHGIKAIIPSEGFLVAVRPAFADIRHLLPYSQDESITYAGLSKFDVANSLRSTAAPPGIADHMPSTLLVDMAGRRPTRADLEKLGCPLYLKVDATHSPIGRGGAVFALASADDALEQLATLSPHFSRALVQGHVPGRGVGVFFLLWEGRLLAEFMHRRVHEVPHTGGVSSLRESWWHPAIRDDALAKLRHLGWQGIAMLEYRWDPQSRRFYFIEMNGRFWGSLHLALYAGVDFPRLLLDAFHGHSLTGARQFPLGVRCRWTFPKEVQYVWSRLKDGQVPLLSRLWSVLEFLLLSCDPRLYSDLLFPRDRRLYWTSMQRWGKDSFLGLW